MPSNEATVAPALRIDANAGLGPEASLALAQSASGSLEAQRLIRSAWASNLYHPDRQGPDRDLTDAGGIFVARLCAAHGDHSDVNMLAMLLLNVGIRYHEGGRLQIGWECIAEALSLYERMGDAGDPEAVEAAKTLMPTLPIEVVARAKEYSLQGKNDGIAHAPICARAVH